MSPLDWLLAASWQAAALALAVLFVSKALGRRVSPRWRHRLWWIVVLRLLLPPISVPGFHLPAATTRPTAPTPLAAAAPPAAAPVDSPPVTTAGPVAAAPDAATTLAPGRPPAAGSPRAKESGESTPAGPEPAAMLLALWLAGAAVLALAAVLREVRLKRLVWKEPLHDDDALLDLVERCRIDAGIRRSVRVVRTRVVSVPAVVGLLRPRILLPDAVLHRLSAAGIADVIRHEMEHLRRRDGLASRVLSAAVFLHWPNPLAWLAAARLRAERETVCDLDALRRDPSRSPREYARTILAVASASPLPTRPALVAALGSRNDVRRRITMITRFAGRPFRLPSALAGAGLALVLATSAVLLASEPAPAAGDAAPAARPRVLVTGFEVTGDLLEKDGALADSLEVLTEALLAKRHATVGGSDLRAACEKLEADPADLAASPDLRLAVAKRLRVAACLTGWACSFGDRVVLIIEVIVPGKGLPGAVHHRTCDGVDEIPEALEALLTESVNLTAPDRVEHPGSRPGDGPGATAGPAAGAIDLDELIAGLPDDDLLETYPNDAYLRLEELRRQGRWFRSDDERDAVVVRRLPREVVEHTRRLHEDETYRAEYVVRGNVRRDPALSQFEFDVTSRGPCLLFVERPEPGRPAPAAGAGYAATLARLHDEFRARFVGGKSLPAGDAGVIRGLVFTRPGSMAAYQKTIGQTLPPGVMAYYSPATRFLVLDAPAAGETAPVRLVHEGFHQIVQAYGPAARAESLWLNEGLAEFVAGASAGDGYDYAAAYPARIGELRATRRMNLAEWSLPELLQPRSIRDMSLRARKKGLAAAGQLTSLYFAQAWSFCHFLWNFEDGKYRERLLAAVRDSLEGEAPTDPEAWAGLEAEWNAYVDDLLEAR